MRYMRVKIKTLRIEHEALLHELIDESFDFFAVIPLPDSNHSKVLNQTVKLSTYEVMSFNEFAFNSLALYKFKVDEKTLAEYINAEFKFGIEEQGVTGSLKMNKLIMAENFTLNVSVDLTQTKKEVTETMVEGRKRPRRVEKVNTRHAGSVVLEINLQKNDTEDQLKQNYDLQMRRMTEERNRAEEQRQEMLRRQMNFEME